MYVQLVVHVHFNNNPLLVKPMNALVTQNEQKKNPQKEIRKTARTDTENWSTKMEATILLLYFHG